MSYESAFRADILAHPADDTPRLVYADWLEERGDARGRALAEFIRVQMELEKPREQGPELWGLQQREDELLRAGRLAWLGRLRELVLGTAFRRGFLHTVTMKPAGFVQHAANLFTEAPIQGLRLTTRSYPNQQSLSDDMAALASSTHLRQITDLHLSVSFTAEEAQALAANLVALTNLELDANFLTLDVVQPFLASPHAARLRSLTLAGGLLESGLPRAVAECPALVNLTTLRLRTAGGLEREDVESLASSPFLRRLRVLELSDNRLAVDAIRALTRGQFMTSLEEFVLGGNALDDGAVCALVNRINAPNLRRLDLSRNELKAVALEALADCAGMPSLTELTLRFNNCAGAGLAALMQSDRLDRLRVLLLRNTGLSDDDLRTLARSRLLTQLIWLELNNNRLTDSGVSDLLKVPDLGRLARLDLSGCPIGSAKRERLEARLGNVVRF